MLPIIVSDFILNTT